MSYADGGPCRRIGRIYESAELLAVDKPAGLACIPTRDAAASHVLGILSGESGTRLYVVHRLDAETSGVLVFAKTAEMHRWLSMRFEQRLVRKEYLALVCGCVPGDGGRIDSPLRVCGSGRVAVDFPRGKPCTTEFEVLGSDGEHSLLLVRPLTGRQHQIRAHLFSIGHPVAGDRRYGGQSVQQGYARLMLHAWRLEAPMPDGGRLLLEAPPPDGLDPPGGPSS